jgi:uncharacterized membrane protein
MIDDYSRKFTYLAGFFALFYFSAGIIGLFSFFNNSFLFGRISNDPIELILLILIAIIYFRGFLKLKHKDKTGTAFIFVAAIMGIILGGLSFLSLIINNGLGDFLEGFSFPSTYNQIVENFSFIIVIGSLSLIPFKIIKSIEYNLVVS